MHLASLRLRFVSGLCVAAAMACHFRTSDSIGIGAGPRLSDADIIAIVLAANNTDLSYARLVPARARSADVKAFAQRMTNDHTILNTRITDIAQRNGIVPADNEISLDFRDRSAARRDILRELEGARFDSSYAANEIQYHTELLTALQNVLSPNARNAELQEFVANLRPAVTAHLTHAEQIRSALATRK